MNDISLYVSTPTAGSTGLFHNSSVRALGAWCRESKIPCFLDERSGAPVDQARDSLAAAYLAARHDGQMYSHCLMVDANIGFGVETVKRLLEADEDFAVAAAPLRETRTDKVAEKGDEKFAATFSLQYTRETLETGKPKIVRKGEADFMEIDHLGVAMACVRKNVFTKIWDAYPELRHKDGCRYFRPGEFDAEGRSYAQRQRAVLERVRKELALGVTPELAGAVEDALAIDPAEFLSCGEDVSFCKRWTGVGGKIWLLIDAPLVHEGHGYWAGNVADQVFGAD
jgi:hypothetical protein